MLGGGFVVQGVVVVSFVIVVMVVFFVKVGVAVVGFVNVVVVSFVIGRVVLCGVLKEWSELLALNK